MFTKTSALLALLPLLKANAYLFPSIQHGCTNRPMNDHEGYDSLTAAMGTDLDGGAQVDPHKRVFKYTGGDHPDPNNAGALLAVCNYAGNSQGGSRAEIDYFNYLMDAYCGSYMSGWVYVPDWDKTYWRSTNPGDDFCNNL